MTTLEKAGWKRGAYDSYRCQSYPGHRIYILENGRYQHSLTDGQWRNISPGQIEAYVQDAHNFPKQVRRPRHG